MNFAPNVATYVLPAMAFPAQVRSTFHGLSAGLGKVGAVVGTFMFHPIKQSGGTAAVLWVQFAICVLGVAVSVWCIDEGAEDAPTPSCVVCMENFKLGEELRVLACGHEFHKECIDEWLLETAEVKSFFDKASADVRRAAKRPVRDCPLCKAYPLTEAILNAPYIAGDEANKLGVPDA